MHCLCHFDKLVLLEETVVTINYKDVERWTKHYQEYGDGVGIV
jgi:hypothetical protein